MNLHTAIKTAVATAHLPSMAPALIGSVGIGKTNMLTDHAHRFAARQGSTAAVITVHVSQISSTEVLGLPHFEKQTLSNGTSRIVTTWSVPGIIHAVNDAHEAGNMPFLFLDELFLGSAETIKAVRQLIGERRLGQHRLPPDTRIIAASNRSKDRAGVGAIATHMINVLMLLHIRWNIKTDWLPWASTQDFLPIFIDWMANQSHEFLSDDVPKDINTPFPTVRSLTLAESVIRSLTPADETSLSGEIIDAITGLVGVAAANSLAAHARLREFLPTLEAIAENPEGAVLPANRPDIHSILTHLIPQVVPNEDELVEEDPFAFGTTFGDTEGSALSCAHTSKIEAALAYTDRLPAEFRPAVWEAILRRTKGRACTVPAMRRILKEKGKAFLHAALNAL